MSREVWVTVAVTDRAASLRQMLSDVLAQAEDVHARLTLLVLENSRAPSERRTTADTVAVLRARGVAVTYLDRPPYRRPICDSRRMQRDWIAQELRNRPAPTFVWMLDDDNRLDHCVRRGDQVQVEMLEHHIARLLAWAEAPRRPDLVIGEVTGDPPIPPLATYASRLGDLRANLEALVCARPGSSAKDALRGLPNADGHDVYYDFSHEREVPSWRTPCRWPVASGEASETALGELIGQARWLGGGVAGARPIVTHPDRLMHLDDGYRRGGNAVFFDAAACLAHAYPSVSLGGVATRRSDMIGSRLLQRSACVRTSGFSVRHCRRRVARVPSAAALRRSLVGDTYGAALARSVAQPGRQVVRAFLDRRLDVVQRALEHARREAAAVVRLLRRSGWDERNTGAELLAVVDGVADAIPAARDVTVWLRDPRHRDAVQRAAERWLQADGRGS